MACDKRQRIYVNTLIDYWVQGVNSLHTLSLYAFHSPIHMKARVAFVTHPLKLALMEESLIKV